MRFSKRYEELMNQFKMNHAVLAERFAPIMFIASLLFLVLVAALIVVWVDIPRFAFVNVAVDGVVAGDGKAVEATELVEPAELVVDPILETANHVGHFLIMGIAALWVIIVLEVMVQLYVSVRTIETINVSRWRIFALLQCMCPPLRLAAPNIAKEGKIWFPVFGWQSPRRKLYKKLEAAFSKPMLFFALLILPLLLIEFGLHSVVEQQTWLRVTIHICTGLIWLAFAIEFIVLVSASDRRLKYVKKNWIDLAIILLPIVLFLRSLRAIRMAKVMKLAKVEQLVRLSRMYRVRGVAMKLLRTLMLFEFFGRILGGSPENRLKRLEMDRREKLEELEEIDADIVKVKAEIEKKNNLNEQ